MASAQEHADGHRRVTAETLPLERPGAVFALAGLVLDYANFRHLGGGRKGLLLLLRYVFIASASYLLLFRLPGQLPSPTLAFVIASALASNVALSFVPVRHLLSWYLAASVLVVDTLWVSWALHSTGADGQGFFLLYSFVVFLSMLGENLPVMLVGSGLVFAANFVSESPATMFTSAHLLHLVFLYTVALFYGHVLGQVRHERARADRGFAWALELVDGLLDLRKLESGKMPLEIEPVHLAPFLGHFQRRERLPVAPNVALRWRIGPALPEIETDVAKLSIVLDNLVNNAIKFTRDGTITVSASDVPAERRVVFRVEDTGPGIPSEHLAAIFEPFHQVDERSDRAGGVGLGLAIVRHYVALLGGEIRVSSQPGAGTRFEITLPYRPGEPASDMRPGAESREQRRAA